MICLIVLSMDSLVAVSTNWLHLLLSPCVIVTDWRGMYGGVLISLRALQCQCTVQYYSRKSLIGEECMVEC